MNDLTKLKEQYEKLGNEIKDLESKDLIRFDEVLSPSGEWFPAFNNSKHFDEVEELVGENEKSYGDNFKLFKATNRVGHVVIFKMNL